MTVLTREIPPNPVLQRFGGAQLPATVGESLRAAITDPRLRPTELLGTELELEEERGESTVRNILGLAVPGIGPLLALGTKDEDELSEVVPPERLNDEYKDLGLSFDRPTRRRVAEILAEQKKADLIRQDTLMRAPGGIVGTGAVLAASLAGSVIDPLNVAVSFIPIVRETRYAAWAARSGPTAARAARGAVEGVVGNAAIEPAVFGLSRQQQLDYTMADALLNIGLGGLIGGGLHAVGGRFGDYMTRQPPEVREAALRGSVAQVAQGKSVDVSPVLRDVSLDDINRRMDVENRAREILSENRVEAVRVASALAADRETLVANVRALQRPEQDRGLIQFLSERGGIKEQGGELRNMGITPKSRPGLIRKNGMNLDDAALAAWEGGLFPELSERPTIPQLLEKLDEEFNRGRKATGADAPDRATERQHAQELDRALNELGLSSEEPEFIADVVRRVSEEPPFGELDTAPLRRVEVAEMIRRESAPERDSAADFRASERVDEINETAEDARGLVEQASNDLELMRASGDLDDDLAAQLGVADEFETVSEGWTRAVRQAGHCLI